MKSISKLLFMAHIRCRGEFYPREKNIKRFQIDDEHVPWHIPLPNYQPTVFTADKILSSTNTDVDLLTDTEALINFNEIDNKIDRTSFTGNYQIIDGLPRNPCGRTGIKGRGCLYYWGPNHAADPVVTTWKRDHEGNLVLHPISGKPILKFVGIYRKHDNEWALPGGMVDPGENVTNTIKREFSEEALNTTEKSESERHELHLKIDNLFVNGRIIYRGYVDDPRNTDNSWMETVAMNFHDEAGDSLAQITLEAGDDATAIKWMELESNLNLYASHSSILRELVSIHDAHWE